MSVQIAPALIDELMDRYVEWREACVVLKTAYEHWASVPTSERELAFVAYVTALDWEEQASAVYADCIDRITPAAPRAHPSDAALEGPAAVAADA